MERVPEETSHSAVTERRIKRRARTTNDPLAGRASTNTAQGRRISDLYNGFMDALGRPTDPLVQADCLAAAELKTAAETIRSALLAGTASAKQAVNIERMADRLVRKLGIDTKPARKPGRPAVIRPSPDGVFLQHRYGAMEPATCAEPEPGPDEATS